ncbi:MAG: isoamylase early set domain-containing protein [Chloroflexota bacterium]|jgi:1,4-alpha-glucan branching enzyme|nr:isoamylase early set domain-containing protein [Anaerolineae bacterium]HMM27348.1 isoamylase early set domain-containing protein [Aggregatilineaceae bacterium]
MLKKQYLKRGTVKVDFVLPSAIAAEASSAYLVGDFNNWDESATPMTKLKNGTFKVTLELEPGRDYKFRYLVNGDQWHNDWDADRYEPNPFSGDNSVVSTHPQ